MLSDRAKEILRGFILNSWRDSYCNEEIIEDDVQVSERVLIRLRKSGSVLIFFIVGGTILRIPSFWVNFFKHLYEGSGKEIDELPENDTLRMRSDLFVNLRFGGQSWFSLFSTLIQTEPSSEITGWISSQKDLKNRVQLNDWTMLSPTEGSVVI